ncbi:TetR/AcrR family transcriptional regulator [Silvibacterium sp.]|uniref:TetR/AcrR family transcriptional regulator n=1 Tax=Silvibacterium sp. TaxID=1964179 RepID=UPI0039E31D0E
MRRTRQLLREAVEALLTTQPFDAISVQQIAERAGVNRATFYAHYLDREALVEDLVRSRFEQLLAERQVRFDGSCPAALRVVILAVYDFVRQMSPGCREQQRHFDPFMQTVVQSEVEKVLGIGIDRGAFALGGSPKMVGAALSWAIYGAATTAVRTQGYAESETCAPDERFVDEIYSLLLPLLSPGITAKAIAEAHKENA